MFLGNDEIPQHRYPRRGDVFYADLGESAIGSEQTGVRPVLIIQNDIGNRFSPTTIIAPISSRKKNRQPTHCFVEGNFLNGLTHNSCIILEQVRTISKTRLINAIGHLDDKTMEEVDRTIAISLGLEFPYCRKENDKK